MLLEQARRLRRVRRLEECAGRRSECRGVLLGKAAALHLGRCLAEEGGPHGIRVNTVNPDAVIEGSSIWSTDWKAERASTYGLAEDELQTFYQGRTKLGVAVLPEDVAEAVAFFAGPASAKSTGNIINVDGGVTAAYPR